MTRDDVFDLIRTYFREQFEVPEAKIRPDAHLFTDLGLDSIDALDMIGMLEKRLDVEIGEEEVKGIRTVGDVIDFIQRKTEGR